MIVMADGFGGPYTGELGSNQDPCVFSDPWGLFHSLCRLDGGSPFRQYVRMKAGRLEKKPLSQIVRPGDIILYGKTDVASRSFTSIWIDSVLVVERLVELPTEAVPNRKTRRFVCSWGSNDLPNASSDAFKNNLEDTHHNHKRTRFYPHNVIVGAAMPKSEALTNLQTSFVPLGLVGANQMPDVVSLSSLDLPDDWAEVSTDVAAAIWPRKGGAGNSGRIAEIAWDTAKVIAKAVIGKSGDGQPGLRGFVAIPPLHELRVRPPGRSSRTCVDHVATDRSCL